MGPGSDATPRLLDVVVHQWPLLIFLPAVLVLLVVMIVVTRIWDARDARRLADVVAGPRPAAAPVRGNPVRRWWRHRTRCRCSWHADGHPSARATPVGAQRGAVG